MKLTALENKRKPGQTIAWLGKQLCLFERGSKVEIGTEVEVMFVMPIYGITSQNKRIVTALIVRPVTEEYILVPHIGFECSGSMCQTTSRVGNITKELNIPHEMQMITPGKSDVWVAGNVNVGFNGQKYKSRRPGEVWVKTSTLARLGRFIVEGLTKVEDGAYYELIKEKVVT